MSSPPTATEPAIRILIIYNATSTLLGKLTYSYRHITCKGADNPACAACDITHGGLHLDETAAWKAAKKIFAEQYGRDGGAEIKQLHRDELDRGVKTFVEEERKLQLPVVLGRRKGVDGYEVLMQREELAAFKGDAGAFGKALRGKVDGGFKAVE